MYVESSLTDGGSNESLYLLLRFIDRSEFEPYVVFLNKTRYFDYFKRLGIGCFVVSDSLYDKEFSDRHPFMSMIIARTKMAIDLALPFLSIRCEKLVHFSTIREIMRLIVLKNIEIVHANNQVNRDLYAIECARRAGIACVSHLRTFWSMGFNHKKASLANEVVSKYIAYSRSIADHWISMGVDPSKVEVVYNGIEDFDVKKVHIHRYFGIRKHCYVIGIVGMIRPARGHEFLIEAFAELLRHREDVHLLIVGGAENGELRRVSKLVEKRGIQKYTTFAGHYPDARKIIAGLDVLVLPYSVEPFGRVLLEAWRLEVPVVVTDVGHIREIVTDNENGLLVRYGDIDQMKRTLLRLLEDEGLRKQLVKKSLEKCRMHFSAEYYAKRIEMIYRSLQ